MVSAVFLSAVTNLKLKTYICTFLVDCLVWSTITHWIETRFAHSLVLSLSLSLFISAGKKAGVLSLAIPSIPRIYWLPLILQNICDFLRNFIRFWFQKKILIQCIYPIKSKTDHCHCQLKRMFDDTPKSSNEICPSFHHISILHFTFNTQYLQNHRFSRFMVLKPHRWLHYNIVW